MRRAWVAIVLLFAAFAVFLYWSQQKANKWAVHYLPESHDPYGLSLLWDLLAAESNQAIEKNQKYLDEWQTDSLHQYELYLSIGYDFYRDSSEIVALKRFISQGGKAMIAAQYFNAESLGLLTDSQLLINPFSYPSDTVNLQLPNDSNRRAHVYVRDEKRTIAVYRQSLMFLAKDAEIVMVDEDKNNKAIRLNMGSGSLLLILEPVLFSNLHLRRKSVKTLADVFFNQYKTGPILWETGLRKPRKKNEDSGAQSSASNDEQISKSPLAYILAQKGLKESWYVLMFALLMFLFFHIRSRQRPMPMVYALENQSLEEVKTLSNLYLSRPLNRELAEMKVLYLRYQLKKNFQMDLSSFQLEAERLSARTGVRQTLVKSLAEKLTLFEQNNDLSEGFVQDLCRSVNRFYEEAGL